MIGDSCKHIPGTRKRHAVTPHPVFSRIRMRVLQPSPCLKEKGRPGTFQAIPPSRYRHVRQGLPNVIMSTGCIFEPSKPFMSPRCFTFGILMVVLLIGNGSISLAHTGSIPESIPANGKHPDPSKSEPSVSLFSIVSFPGRQYLLHDVVLGVCTPESLSAVVPDYLVDLIPALVYLLHVLPAHCYERTTYRIQSCGMT